MGAEEMSSSGWQAIDDALIAIYGDQQPFHVGYDLPAALSSNLQGCSAYAASNHWHYVSYGLSELYEPQPDEDPSTSGWGFELTFRLVRGDEGAPPEWPFIILNRLANFQNEGTLTIPPAGTRINLRAPITGYPNIPGAPDTTLTVFAVTTDPELGEIETPNGHVSFLQLVGVTDAEKERMLATSTSTVLDSLAEGNPMLVTDIARGA